MLRRLRWKLRGVAQRYSLAKEFGAEQWFFLGLLGRQELIKARMYGIDLWVRSGTHDLKVAASCLGGEFSKTFQKVTTLRHKFIIDAGGYIGSAAIAFARHYPQATVVTLEPSKANFEVLQKNIAGFGNIIAINSALSDAPGRRLLRDRGTGHWGFTLVDVDRTSKGDEAVDCVTIQQVMTQFGADGIDIIKIDIEGGELPLLSGDTGWIEKTEYICIELHDRFAPGCSQAWQNATKGRTNGQLEGEKYDSQRTDA